MNQDKGYTYNLLGEAYKVRVEIGKYQQGNPAIELYDLEDGFPFGKSTVNIPGLAEDEVAVKDYSENKGMLDFLVDNGIIYPPHRSESSGYATVPVCKLVLDK
jgi:hypothetical protein